MFTKRSAENPLSQPIIRQGKSRKINRFFFLSRSQLPKLNSRQVSQHFFFSSVFEGIQCPSCEGKDENDCDSQIKMEICPKETPTCAVYTSDKGHFNRGCANQAEYETLLNKCEEHGDCTIRKYGKS